ncbi:MAG: hypothetical protein JJD92_08780 [Frankiaceae bacterium]|nr:hypothetical protein [Frankiaceae bacterium]
MRRLLALALPLVAAAGVLPAVAAPAESSRAAVVRIALPTDDGEHLEVELRAIARSSASYLAVSVTFCDPDCQGPRYYAGALPKGSLTADADTAAAHLEAVIGGIPFEVTWRPAERSGAVVGSLHGGGSGADSTFAIYNGAPATAVVTISTGDCTTDATVGDEHEVSTSAAGNDIAAPLSRLRLRPTDAPSCSA